MKVSLKSNFTSSTNPLRFVLSNRGFKKNQIDTILNPKEELMPNWRNLKHIEDGLAMLKKHIDNGNKIGITVDEDADGLTSAAIFYKYIKQNLNYENVETIIHNKRKVHGIPFDESLEVLTSGDLLINPDSGSNDFVEQEKLHALGIDVLVVDHHLATEKKTDAIIINNQLSPNFENKELTGSAMSYLFCLAYSELYDIEPPNDLKDLAAVGMVADRADFSKDLGAYYLMRTGLHALSIKSKMLKRVIEKNNNLTVHSTLTAKDVGFSIAPAFNSVFRMGTQEELRQIVDGMCDLDYTIYNSRKKMEQSIIDEAYLRTQSVRNRQKKAVDSALEKIMERIKEKGSDKHKIIIVNSTGIVEDSGLNGLIATKLVSEFKKPVLIVKVVGDELKGSARNLNNCPIESLNDLLTSTGKFVCSGHDNAFGVSFKLEDAMTIQQELDELLKDVNFNDAKYEVDFEWNGYVDVPTILELGKHSDIWCNGIDEPLICIKEKIINKKDIQFIGARGSTMKIEVDGISCVKFFMSEAEKTHIVDSLSDLVSIDLVCTASINTFKGMNLPQLMIEAYEINNVDSPEMFEGLSVDSLPF